MSGVLFVVIVPRKEYEESLRKTENSANVVIDQEKPKNTLKLINELKENKKFTSLSVEPFVQDDDIVLSKCKSIDCLHASKKSNLFKCKSENVLAEVDKPLGYKHSVKSSWEELKQVMRPRRNKLRITNLARGVDSLAAFHSGTPLETILSEVIKRLAIKNAAWTQTKNNNFWQVIFSLESSNICEETLQVLRTFGVGSRYQSSVSVIPCALYYQSDFSDHDALLQDKLNPSFTSDSNNAWSRFTSSVKSRTNLAQVLHDVRSDAALTFDWLFLLIVAAFVAAIGLVENSTVILVASMLISPLMGPITAGTLGTAVNDRSLQRIGVNNELLGLFLALVIGFIFGLAICAVDERYGIGDWPTYEMMTRCEIRSLWVGVLVAIPSGAGVVLAVLGENTASFVGVAISASLLPPAVNCGLLWAMSLVHLIFLDDATRWTSVVKTALYSTNPAVELAVLGTMSLCLTLVNIVCIFLAGVAVYKVKEVSPLERREISWWRANRNLMQASKRSYHNQDNGPAWNLYNNCYEQNDEQVKAEKGEFSPELVQSDTVTYRRRQHTPRANLQDIGTLYQQPDDMTDEDYDPLGSQATVLCENKGQSPSNSNLDEDSIEYPDFLRKHANLCDTTHSFHNMGFEGDFRTKIEKYLDENSNRPTIEPSSCLTVDSKNRPLLLANKSFDV